MVDFYNEINLETKILEIICTILNLDVPRDKAKEEFEEHYDKMPWITIPFGDSRNRKLVEVSFFKLGPRYKRNSNFMCLEENGE